MLRPPRGQIESGIMFPASLRRDILLLVCVKAAALVLIYCSFVAPKSGPAPDGPAMVQHLLNASRH
jgi:hypothetical protein